MELFVRSYVAGLGFTFDIATVVFLAVMLLDAIAIGEAEQQ